MIGPGEYDAECTELRQRLKAQGIILIVFGGARGQGFSAQLPLDRTLAIADALMDVAREIKASGITAGAPRG